ncbi:hypothetical protein CC86DRAFT_404870 [Ophiobolus disseminans]|uniref:DUF7029 domain-containing protein n=1 Tax=Ophiobolus disseminans TaxID=1469910 RepID=A0A6A7A514_9PLEO|nr:hypothetical protein CC86DRAFT_404870 [Ophiobolus disseminans]
MFWIQQSFVSPSLFYRPCFQLAIFRAGFEQWTLWNSFQRPDMPGIILRQLLLNSQLLWQNRQPLQINLGLPIGIWYMLRSQQRRLFYTLSEFSSCIIEQYIFYQCIQHRCSVFILCGFICSSSILCGSILSGFVLPRSILSGSILSGFIRSSVILSGFILGSCILCCGLPVRCYSFCQFIAVDRAGGIRYSPFAKLKSRFFQHAYQFGLLEYCLIFCRQLTERDSRCVKHAHQFVLLSGPSFKHGRLKFRCIHYDQHYSSYIFSRIINSRNIHARQSRLAPNARSIRRSLQSNPGTYTMLIRAVSHSGDKGILLENIGAVGTLTCMTGQILVDFADAASADIARTWPAGTVLYTLADGCNSDDERGVYVISKVSQPSRRTRRTRASSNVVAFSVSKTTLQGIADELDISYGHLVSAADGSQMTSYTTTMTSYFTHSRVGTVTSSIFVTTITPSLTTETFTSTASSTPSRASIATSSSADATPSPNASAFSLSPAAQAILNDLSAGLPAPGRDGTITIPIKKGSDAPLVAQPVGIEPFNRDPVYQAKLENAMAADHLDSTETLVAGAVDALAEEGESNVPEDSPVKLANSDYAGTDDAVYDSAPLVSITTTSGTSKRDAPARAASAPAPRAAMTSSDIAQSPARHSLNKRDGWDTFFDVMGDDLIGEICEICGAISAGKDLYDAMKCILGSCPAPPQVTVNMLEGTSKQDFSLSAAMSPKNGEIFKDSIATVLCADCYIKVSSLRLEGLVRVLPKQMHVKENFVISASFTATQSSVTSLLYNIRTKGAGSGTFSQAFASWPLDSVTAPGVITIAPKFIWGMGLTYDTAQAVDVQAGAVITLTNAAADIDIKAQTASNARNWQSSAQVTFPKITQPGRVILSPYLKTDFQISLTIFGQYVENAVVLTSQTNMGFDTEVLTSSQVVKRQTAVVRAQTIKSSSLAKRGFFTKLIEQIAAKQAAAAAQQTGPKPPVALCNAGSMKLSAIMTTKSQAIVGGKPNTLYDQPYKFGAQCLPFAAPFGSSSNIFVHSTIIGLSIGITVLVHSTVIGLFNGIIAFQHNYFLIRTHIIQCLHCSVKIYDCFYPPAGSKCFKVVGRGAQVEGKYLTRPEGNANPVFRSSGDEQAIFYTDSNGYMYEAYQGLIMATANTGVGWWVQFSFPQFVTSAYTKAICTKNSATLGLSCFQTSSDVMAVAPAYDPNDERSMMPMWGQASPTYKLISLSYEDIACPTLCPKVDPVYTPMMPSTINPSVATSTPVPSVVASTPILSSISSTQPSASINAQCSNSLPTPAPAGSKCFTITGHGPSHVEGQLLGISSGFTASTSYLRAAFGWGFDVATFYTDSNGYLWVASENSNGNVLSLLPTAAQTPYLAFYGPGSLYNGGAYVKAICSLGSQDRSLTCSIKSYTVFMAAPEKLFYGATDTRSGTPVWGPPYYESTVSMSMSYNEVACPVKCGSSSALPATSSAVQPAKYSSGARQTTTSSPPQESWIAASSTPSGYPPRPTAASSSNAATPTLSSASLSLTPSSTSSDPSPSTPSSTPSATPGVMLPCDGHTSGPIAISNAAYIITCGATGASPITRQDVIFAPSFRACMEACNTKTGCRAVMFREIAPVGGKYQCTRYSAMGAPPSDGLDWEGTFDVARRVIGVGFGDGTVSW